MSLLEVLELLLVELVLPVHMLTQVRLQGVRGMVSMMQAAERVTLPDTGDTPRRQLRQQMHYLHVHLKSVACLIAATCSRNQPTAGVCWGGCQRLQSRRNHYPRPLNYTFHRGNYVSE
jgi:hypothetical protein